MRKSLLSYVILLILLMTIGSCENMTVEPDHLKSETLSSDLSNMNKSNAINLQATGGVEIVWTAKGNNPFSLQKALFEFNANAPFKDKPAKGEVALTIIDSLQNIHREIHAEVFDCYVDPLQSKAWFVAVVVSDSKECSTDPEGNHGEPGEGEEVEHDGGCSHDDTLEEGGGCGEDDSSTEHGDGCSDLGEEHDGSEGGMGPGNALSGKNCRIGQLIAIKVHDNGTPGINGDGLTWKWFSSDGQFASGVGNTEEWPHLCKKTIVGGNIVVHD